MSNVKRVHCNLTASLDVVCPSCKEEWDLLENDGPDNDYLYADIVFNSWEKMENTEVTCPFCGYAFEISHIVW